MAEQTRKRLTLSADPRFIIIILLAVIAAMLVMWRPWMSSSRTVEVRGEATVTAVPDEFIFMPSYEFKHADTSKALADLTAKTEEVVAKLKELGVGDEKIKTNSNGYDYRSFPETTTRETTYTTYLTVEVGDKELAQKVQDYLITTSPTGSVTPQANFSDEKRRELEEEARDQATRDARAKADQMGANLGFKVGKVKSVSDNSGFGAIPLMGGATMMAEDSKRSSLTVQPGENELMYSVVVIYYVR